jgi:hypothetical protein
MPFDPAWFAYHLGAAIAANRPPPDNRRAEDKLKFKDPPTFDGKSPDKLEAFITACELCFRMKPKTYEEDQVKIHFMVSYLVGTAADWYRPYLIEPTFPPPRFTYDYGTFLAEFKALFGDPFARTNAEQKLRALHMTDTQHVSNYRIEFQAYANRILWDTEALHSQFYWGLADRIKNAMAVLGKPASLPDLMSLALHLDQNHWERQAELKHGRQAPSAPSRSSVTAKTSAFAPASGNSKPASAFSKGQSKSKSSKAVDKPYANVLGSDGKLLPEGKERRVREHLCLLCGDANHFSDKCPKRSDAKGRHAQPEDEESSEESMPPPEEEPVPSDDE